MRSPDALIKWADVGVRTQCPEAHDLSPACAAASAARDARAFPHGRHHLPFNLGDFWSWALSDLASVGGLSAMMNAAAMIARVFIMRPT